MKKKSVIILIFRVCYDSDYYIYNNIDEMLDFWECINVEEFLKLYPRSSIYMANEIVGGKFEKKL